MESPRVEELMRELAALPEEFQRRLHSAGFDEKRLISLARTLEGPPETRRTERNRVRGDVRPPAKDEILELPETTSAEAKALRERGHDALSRGEVALCVMAGGMATRMGGVVKALVEVKDGVTFLDMRLAENRAVSARAGKSVPLWLMVSEATRAPIDHALKIANAPSHVHTFEQTQSLRLNGDGTLFRGADGQPSSYAPGHGDLIDSLRRSGLLDEFRKNAGKNTPKSVWIANLDNLGATVDEEILGAFLASGKKAMVEVCDKAEGDRGGIPVHAPSSGSSASSTSESATNRLQVLEEFRLPTTFDASTVRVFNTNTFLVDTEALATTPIEWNWFEVEKKVDGKAAIQFERLLQELTGAVDTAYLRVPREGAASRFLPVKDLEELARRREAILAVAQLRGMLTTPA
ncbi:MAG: UTP--glucose-1-phosphate uridylyltransferase [Polyangiaceae bacterium]